MVAASRKSQRGFTLWGWMIVISIAVFFLTLAAKLGPVYIGNYKIQSTVKALQNEPELSSKSIPDIREAVQRKFDVNNIDTPKASRCAKGDSCLKIEKTKDLLRIDANYESRVHVLGNVDAVVVFNNNFVELPIKGDS
jgi:Tfp pilus assembly major pilin PilA